MNNETFFQEDYQKIITLQEQTLQQIQDYKDQGKKIGDYSEVVYCTSRIKSYESTIEKLNRKNYPLTKEAALNNLHDIIGFRIICSFIDDIYDLVHWFKNLNEFECIQEKDYIHSPKPNGYRTYHIILKHKTGLYIEIQIRTIALDFWANLEHKMVYKHDIHHRKIIQEELKKCADEIASIDCSMQTIRDLLMDESF